MHKVPCQISIYDIIENKILSFVISTDTQFIEINNKGAKEVSWAEVQVDEFIWIMPEISSELREVRKIIKFKGKDINIREFIKQLQ